MNALNDLILEMKREHDAMWKVAVESKRVGLATELLRKEEKKCYALNTSIGPCRIEL